MKKLPYGLLAVLFALPFAGAQSGEEADDVYIRIINVGVGHAPGFLRTICLGSLRLARAVSEAGVSVGTGRDDVGRQLVRRV